MPVKSVKSDRDSVIREVSFNQKSIIFAGDSAAVHIGGAFEIRRCPQGEK